MLVTITSLLWSSRCVYLSLSVCFYHYLCFCLSLSMCLSLLSFFVSVSLYRSLCLSLCFTPCLWLCPSLCSISVCLYHRLCLPLSLFLYVSITLSLALSLCLPLSLSLVCLLTNTIKTHQPPNWKRTTQRHQNCMDWIDNDPHTILLHYYTWQLEPIMNSHFFQRSKNHYLNGYCEKPLTIDTTSTHLFIHSSAQHQGKQ